MNVMIDHQIDKQLILIDEVSDEAVEAAALVALGGLPTLPHTYCFACPSDPLDTAKPPVHTKTDGLAFSPYDVGLGRTLSGGVEPTRGRSDHRSINPAHVVSNVSGPELTGSKFRCNSKFWRRVGEQTYVSWIKTA